MGQGVDVTLVVVLVTVLLAVLVTVLVEVTGGLVLVTVLVDVTAGRTLVVVTGGAVVVTVLVDVLVDVLGALVTVIVGTGTEGQEEGVGSGHSGQSGHSVPVCMKKTTTLHTGILILM